MSVKHLDAEILAESFGILKADIPEECMQMLETMNKRYRVVCGPEREKLIVEILERIDQDTQVIGAPERTDIWYEGWKENLDDFRKNQFDLNVLMPKFIRKNQPIRFMGEYIVPEEQHFEHVYFDIYRTWLFNEHFKDYDSIYDVGCGCSYNLIKLCEKFPDKKIYGLDFVQSSIDIVNELAEKHKFNTEGRLFNIIEPDFNFELDKNSLVFTSGVIEQIASKFDKFVDFLLEKKPKMVVHIEPTYEVYDQDNLFDYLAAKFHKKRGYTRGYLTKLKKLEAQGKIEILKVKRLNFGSMFFEGYTSIIWRPL